jgi:hypothetical protein
MQAKDIDPYLFNKFEVFLCFLADKRNRLEIRSLFLLLPDQAIGSSDGELLFFRVLVFACPNFPEL